MVNFLAHELHFSGLGDGALLNHAEWNLLGLGAEDTLAELKQIALRGEIIVQSAAGLVQISWKHKNMEERPMPSLTADFDELMQRVEAGRGVFARKL